MESDLEQQPMAAKGVDCLSAIDSRFSTTQTLALSSASYTSGIVVNSADGEKPHRFS